MERQDDYDELWDAWGGTKHPRSMPSEEAFWGFLKAALNEHAGRVKERLHKAGRLKD